MPSTKYPDIEVQLTGKDGNAFWILGRVRAALIENYVSIKEAEKFIAEATAGTYDDLLRTCTRWVTVL